ncbi:MAG: tetratricopeptide repeat protein [Acidobacteriaceae bacterium]|nr:tetratricopeptide repeat protein [Acidobacteriaceae bacterium]MBV9780350.1 tetratricopeptide repeat protein [Acidobacteriaceae bacterium]
MFRVAAAALSVSVALFGQAGQSPQDLLKEAVALQQAGKLDQAIQDYYLFLDTYPNAPEIRSNLGAALAGAGRFAEAIEQYKLALSEKPDPRLRLNLALAYYKSADFKAAVQELETVRDTDPTNLQAVMLLADCDLKLGHNQKTIELLTPLRRTNPDDLGIAYLLGTALVRDGQTAEGQLIIDQILKRGDSAEARLLMGTTKFEAHEFNGALADLKRALELNPNLPGVYAYYGMALMVMGDTARAKDAFKNELAHDPNNFDANLRLGALLRVDQDYAAASPYLQQAQKLRPNDPSVRYQIASVTLAQGKQDQARNQLEALVKEVPSFTEAHVTLATIYYREKRKEDGDRERAIVRSLNQQQQARAPAAKAEQ